VPSKPRGRRIRISPAAAEDIAETLAWSRERFGQIAAARYGRLIGQAIADIRADPGRAGARPRPELAQGVWTYHLYFSRSRSAAGTLLVRRPRHLLVYRTRESCVEIIRVLHEARDLERHLPSDFPPGEGPPA
jgi:toxin ParE1/3/4